MSVQPFSIAYATDKAKPSLEVYDDLFDDEAFTYGWRYVQQKRNGKIIFVRVPLMIEDVLHPKEVTSASTCHLDVESDKPEEETKYKHYAKIGIPCYIIIDEANRVEGKAPPCMGLS